MKDPTWLDASRLQDEVHFDERPMRCFGDRPRNVYALLDAAAALPNGGGVVDGTLHLSWLDVKKQADELATGLIAEGLRTGDRVGLLLGNSASFVVIVFALARLGIIGVPIGTRSQIPEITHALQDSGARALIFDADMVDRLPSPVDVPELHLKICLTDQLGYPSLAVVTARGRRLPPVGEYAAHEEDTAFILYTSGTTGRPKGAMLTHLGVVHSAMNIESCLGLHHDDRCIVSVPMSHVTGLVALMLAVVRSAGTLVVMSSFKAREFLELAVRERMTYTLMVPAMYNLCLLQPEFSGDQLLSWRIGAYGGSPMPPATIRALAEKLPSLELRNVYGATETTSPATMMPPRTTTNHENSVGKSVPCAEIVIVDLDGRPVPTGGIGEIWIRGPMVVKGYWQNQKATREAFARGFWHSGDIGCMDAEGFVRVLDRTKDVINRGGFKVYSSEVEAVLASHPQVIEAAVVGLPCPVLGERVHAFVVTQASMQTQALIAYCAERLSDYKVPETFTFSAESLARNANGKVLKREMREIASQAAAPR